METLSSLIYLVIDNARSQALTREWEPFDDPAVGSVDVYFRSSTDVALVAVHLAPGGDRGRWIGAVVASGISVIDPSRMGEGDRRAFFASYLQRYEVVTRACAGVASAMTALRARAAQKKARGTEPGDAIGEPAAPPRPRLGTPVDQRATDPVDRAETVGSPRARLGSDAPPPDQRAGIPPLPLMGGSRRSTALGLGALRRPADEPTDVAAPGHPITEPGPMARAGGADASPHQDTEPGRPRRERSRTPTDPIAPPVMTRAPTGDPPTVLVRFLRGGQWSPARLRSLSMRGAYLVTGAPPRVNDEVHVALDFAELSTLVRGAVYHVTTSRDAVITGASGFAVRFSTEASPARARLTELLQRARADGVVIRPPPSRIAMRFPVRWPVQVQGAHGGCADALDVSQGGLFVSPPLALGATTVTASIPLDVGDPPIEVRARVARSITPTDAIARGLAPGVGLEIIDMSDGDRVRWQRFLSRVERRSVRTVLVGAAPARLEAITRALTDAGYAVSSSADPGTLIRLADSGPLPDVAVIDDSLLELGVSASWLEQVFTARAVPCITVHGEPLRARMVVDRLLAVAAT